MSKRFVAMTTLCSHIRSNHKLALSRAFLTLASYRELNPIETTANCTETKLKLTKLVGILEAAQHRFT